MGFEGAGKGTSASTIKLTLNLNPKRSDGDGGWDNVVAARPIG